MLNMTKRTHFPAFLKEFEGWPARGYAALKASIILNLAARTAGRKPPIIPITIEKMTAFMAIPNDIRKGKATSEKVSKLVVENSEKFKILARATPKSPPVIEIISDSVKNAKSIARRGNPKARRVPISRVRLDTEAYIVIIAPKIAPAPNMIDMVVPNIVINPENDFDCR